MIFFYSNHTKEDTVFFEEFTAFAKTHDNFLFVPIMTNETSEWTGERGEINRAMLEKYIPDIGGSIYYLSGPSAMVGSMRKLLLDAHVDRTNIRADQFIGY
jgi:ferredoxin-NADP reductase